MWILIFHDAHSKPNPLKFCGHCVFSLNCTVAWSTSGETQTENIRSNITRKSELESWHNFIMWFIISECADRSVSRVTTDWGKVLRYTNKRGKQQEKERRRLARKSQRHNKHRVKFFCRCPPSSLQPLTQTQSSFLHLISLKRKLRLRKINMTRA